jgi:hypothetical protein
VRIFKLVAALVPMLALFGCSSDTAPPLTGTGACDPNWQDPAGQVDCPQGAPVSCDAASQCWETVGDCVASGQCTANNPTPGACDPNWQDPAGQVDCPQGAPVSCDAADQCWPTIADCETAGQCT